MQSKRSCRKSNLMTVYELSIYLNMEVDLIIKKCRKGEIPFVKVGTLFRFEKTQMILLYQKMGFSEAESIEGMVNLYLQKPPRLMPSKPPDE